MNDDDWHYVVATRDGNGFRLYVDGTPAQTTSSQGQTSTTSLIEIGGRSDGSDTFAGLLDDVKLYNAKLDADTVEARYKREINGFCVAAVSMIRVPNPSDAGIFWSKLSVPPVENAAERSRRAPICGSPSMSTNRLPNCSVTQITRLLQGSARSSSAARPRTTTVQALPRSK